MPCYTIVKTTVAFKVENINLLLSVIKKRAPFCRQTENEITYGEGNKTYTINLQTGELTGQSVRKIDEKDLIDYVNGLKREYSSAVINEVARRNKWIKRDMGQNRYQLVRY